MTGVVIALLADNPPRNTGPDFGKASPVGLLILLLLAIGTFALIWSMNRHLKKLPKRFDRGNPAPDQAVGEGGAELLAEPADEDESSPREPG